MRLMNGYRNVERSPSCCSTKETDVALSMRLVDVDSLKLHHPEPGGTGQYNALTYCWGVPLVRGALVQSDRISSW